jgi:hypothetical protein
VGLNTADLHSNIGGDDDNCLVQELDCDHVDVSFYVPVDSEFPMCGFLSIEELCDEHVGGEHQEKYCLQPVPSLSSACGLCVQSLFYPHSIRQNRIF